MEDRDGPWAALIPACAALDALGVSWHVGGSVASSLHGAFRSTNDVDLVADLRAEDAEPFARLLAPTHICDAEWVRGAIARRGSFSAIHEASGFKLDVFVPGDEPFADEVMRRRVALQVPEAGRTIFVASAEDIILRKLRWFRDGGEVARQQWRDVQGVLRLRPDDLDRSHLDRWASVLGVTDLLTKAREEAGSAP